MMEVLLEVRGALLLNLFLDDVLVDMVKYHLAAVTRAFIITLVVGVGLLVALFLQILVEQFLQ